MIPSDFLCENAVPASVAMAAHLVLSSMRDECSANKHPAATDSVSDAGELLRLYLASERRAEASINELRKGIAESISETSLQMNDMTDPEIVMEINRLQLLADLLASAKRAMGRDGGPPMHWDEDEPSIEDDREDQAVPGV